MEPPCCNTIFRYLPRKDLIPGRRDCVKRMCDAIDELIYFIFGKVDGILGLSVKDEKSSTESEMRPEAPKEMNAGAPMRIGSTLTLIDARIFKNF